MKRKFSTFEELAGFYDAELQQPLLRELAICRAAANSNLDESKKAEILLMGGHQWHLNIHPEAKGNIIKKLAASRLWERSYSDFETVYQNVVDVIGDMPYAGALTVYDVAKRIGHCCGVEPERFVYLHSGAGKGTKKLLGINRLNDNKLPVDEFQKYFPAMSALHIENMLCIFKSYFKKGAVDNDVEENLKRCCFKCWFEIPDEIAAAIEDSKQVNF